MKPYSGLEVVSMGKAIVAVDADALENGKFIVVQVIIPDLTKEK